MTISIDEQTFRIALCIVLGVGVLLFVLWFVAWRIIRRGRSSTLDRAEIARRWQHVEELGQLTDESALRNAVVEADSVFDLAMRLKFFAGKDFGGRLKTAQARYERLRSVWEAHRLRNQLVHEPGTRLTRGSAQRALMLYRNGLKELGLL